MLIRCNRFLIMIVASLLTVVTSPAYTSSLMSTGDGSWVWQNPLPQGNEINAVDMVDSKTAWAVGDHGLILKTTDGGATWTFQHSGTAEDLHCVSFVDANTGWVAGKSRVLMKTTDGGETWERRDPQDLVYQVSHEIRFIRFVDKLTGYFFTGIGGRIYRTENGGVSWESISTGSTTVSTLALSGTRNGWIAGRAWGGGSMILGFTDAGKTWLPYHKEKGELNCACASDENTVWVVGDKGKIVRSTDGGRTWKTAPFDTKSNLTWVSFVNPDTGWILDDESVLHKTTDGGITWTAERIDLGRSFRCIGFVDQNVGCVAGRNGLVAFTADGGKTWIDHPSVTGLSTRHVDFVNANSGWIAGGDGSVLRTSDSGATWQQKHTGADWLYSIDFVDEKTGFALGGKKATAVFDRLLLLKTSDGGTTWNALPILKPGSLIVGGRLNTMFFLDKEVGWLGGSVGWLIKTTNGGETWKDQTIKDAGDLQAIQFLNAHTGWALESKGKIWRTDDGGTTWRMLYEWPTAPSLYALCFIDERQGWVAGGTSPTLISNSEIYKTTDGGTSWTQEKTPDPPVTGETLMTTCLLGVDFVDSQVGYAAGVCGTVLKTTDGGTTWRRLDPGTWFDFSGVSFSDRNTGWIVGTGGAILKTSTGGENAAYRYVPQVSSSPPE